MATVVQAVSIPSPKSITRCIKENSSVPQTEHLIIESATAVVTQVAKSNAGDLKEIESNVAKEAVSATDEGVPSLLDKMQDGLQDVKTEMVKGAESAVEAVEQHPELIAEWVVPLFDLLRFRSEANILKEAHWQWLSEQHPWSSQNL